jgi:hypothetical protein
MLAANVYQYFDRTTCSLFLPVAKAQDAVQISSNINLIGTQLLDLVCDCNACAGEGP